MNILADKLPIFSIEGSRPSLKKRGKWLLFKKGVVVVVVVACLCRGFMLSLEWCCFFQYPAFAPGGACVFTWVSSLEWCCFFSLWPLRLLGLLPLQGFHAIVGMVLFFFNIRPLRPVELVFLHEFHRGMVLFLFSLAFAPAGTPAFAGVSCYCWNGVVFFQYPAFAPGGACVLHEFHRWNGVVSFVSGLCACWDSCLCRGFMLSLEWCCFFSISGLCARWSLCFYMSFIVGMVLFLLYLAFAPAGDACVCPCLARAVTPPSFKKVCPHVSFGKLFLMQQSLYLRMLQGFHSLLRFSLLTSSSVLRPKLPLQRLALLRSCSV